MKLLFCDNCWDVFKLEFTKRKCKCGNCWGMYEADGHRSTTNGKGVCLAIDNNKLIETWYKFKEMSQESYEDFYHMCKVHAWFRPHAGRANPRNRVKDVSAD